MGPHRSLQWLPASENPFESFQITIGALLGLLRGRTSIEEADGSTRLRFPAGDRTLSNGQH